MAKGASGLRIFSPMKRVVVLISLVTLISAAGLPVVAQEVHGSRSPRNQSKAADWLSLRPSVELGFVDIPRHTLKFGEGTDTFDYVEQGGQEILFPYQRYRLDMGLGRRQRHQLGLLYQPLTFETVTQFEETLTIDTETFESGQVVDLVYSFDFWRLSYAYRFIDDDPWELEGGISLQIRNASIQFEAQEGNELVISQGNGPVPALRARSRYTFPIGFWIEGEIDGFYASNAFINGAEYPFTGWIWDAAVSAGAPITDSWESYITLRSIGGGAKGTSTDEREVWTESQAGGDERYTSNEIVTIAFAVGFRLLY